MRPEERRRLPGSPAEWIKHAESDLRLARLGAKDDAVQRGQVCFHIQQAAEKAIKAVLLSRGIDFPLVHDIEELLELVLQGGVTVPETVDRAGQLSPYAVEARYPGCWMEKILDVDVVEGLEIAEETILWAGRIVALAP